MKVKQEVWLPQIALEAILGIEFLQRFVSKIKFANGQCQLSVPDGGILYQDRRGDPDWRRVAVSQIDASPKSNVIVPDKFVEFAGKDMFSGTDSSTRFPAPSHFLVARNLANTN